MIINNLFCITNKTSCTIYQNHVKYILYLPWFNPCFNILLMAWVKVKTFYFRTANLPQIKWKFKLWAGKFAWGIKTKHCWALSTNFLYSKFCWQQPAVFCLYTFPAHNLNFQWRWRWWDRIQAIFLNLFHFKPKQVGLRKYCPQWQIHCYGRVKTRIIIPRISSSNNTPRWKGMWVKILKEMQRGRCMKVSLLKQDLHLQSLPKKFLHSKW